MAEWATLIDRIADNIDNPAECLGADWYLDWRTGIGHFCASNHAFGRIHGHAADGVFAQMLCNFEDKQTAVFVHMQCI